MKNRLVKLALRRHYLRCEIEFQRLDFEESVQGLQRPIALLDAALSAWRSVTKHPAVIAGLVTSVLALRHGGLFGLAHTGGRLLLLYPSIALFASKMFSGTPKHAAMDREISIHQ